MLSEVTFESQEFPGVSVTLMRPTQRQRGNLVGMVQHLTTATNYGDMMAGVMAQYVRGWSGLDDAFATAKKAGDLMPLELQAEVFVFLCSGCKRDEEAEGN